MKCVCVEINNVCSHGKNAQGSQWGSSEKGSKGGRVPSEGKELESFLVPLVGWQAQSSWERKCSQSLPTRYYRTEVIMKNNVVGFGWDSQNPVKCGAISWHKINSWPTRCTKNREQPLETSGRKVFSAKIAQNGQLHAKAFWNPGSQNQFCSCFLKYNYTNTER